MLLLSPAGWRTYAQPCWETMLLLRSYFQGALPNPPFTWLGLLGEGEVVGRAGRFLSGTDVSAQLAFVWALKLLFQAGVLISTLLSNPPAASIHQPAGRGKPLSFWRSALAPN